MKKYLNMLLVVMGVALFIPMSAKAINYVPSCSQSKECEEDSTKCTQECKITVENNTASDGLIVVVPTITLTGDADKISLISLEGKNGFTATQSRVGDVITITLTATTPVTTANFELVSFVMELATKDVNCSMSLSVEGQQYGQITIETVTQTQTGATLPVAILICAGIAAGVVYFTSKKTKKLYKI